MNNIFKSAFFLMVGVLGLSLTACTDKYEYDGPGENADGKVYFEQTSQKIQLNKEGNSFQIPVKRLKAEGALEVPVTFTAGKGNIYKVAEKAIFEDGKTEGYINVTYTVDDVKKGSYVGGKITLDPTFASPYGSGTLIFVAGTTEFGVSAWKQIGVGSLTIAAPENDLGHFLSKGGEQWLLFDKPAKLGDRILYQNESNPNQYKIEPYMMKEGFPMTFTVDPKTNRVTFQNVDTGLRTKEKEVVYAHTLNAFPQFKGKDAEAQIQKLSSFDKENKTITFSTIYTAAEFKGIFAAEVEVFVYE